MTSLPGGPRVVRASAMMPELERDLVDRYAAPSLAELDGVVPGVEVAVVGFGNGVTAEVMDRLPDLRAIVNFGVGYDANDVDEARRRGIPIANTPDVLDDCVADVAVGLVIDVMRGLSAADRFVRRGEWAGGSRFPLTRRVTGARVGILGLGRIGLAIARRLEGFDTVISYHSRNRRDDVQYAYATSPIELAASCDVLIVVTPGGPGTQGLVDAPVLTALGPDGFLVNVARGSVVDEDALVAALEDGRIAGAGLDVYAHEPRVPEALTGRDDVVLLPHVASGTVETRRAMADLVLDNVERFLSHGVLLTPVD
ncbi:MULTISPECIES: 2-hydroxyacid dehydrogenase [Nocardioides]|uniref:2-hydroxyacid dehydrogenase n=1 Tax=Nocardioides vastitatis TaxID=2568655 RepID=A0ABW0ZJG6_9ACTN|nr:2-hydroxyacid dehydrogenase [Nocardioides sp.]THI98324.1 2-hydroxyacid dehydrogenase [Nocardioides sp.]